MAISQLTIDLENAYRYWPNREYICLISNRTASDSGGDVLECMVEAKRFELDFKELAVGGGAYVGEDIVWLVPAALLPPDFTIKPSDQAKDGEGSTWDVLNVSYEALESAWALICRDPVIVHHLRDTFTVWSPTNTQDAAGARTPTFADSGTTYNGRFQLVRESPFDGRGKRLVKRDYQLFTAVEISGLTHEYQIKDASSNVYEVVSYTNRAKLGELSMIECVRYGDSA
jgi:hypothetical protein